MSTSEFESKKMEKSIDKLVEVEQEVFSLAASNFTENDEKPWDVGKGMGSMLKEPESISKKRRKVKANDRKGRVPADSSKTLRPAVAFETDHHSETQNFDLVHANTFDKGQRFAKNPTGHLDNNSQGGYFKPLPNPRRRSARIAGKPEVVPTKNSKVGRNKYLHEDLTWTAALERGQQNKSSHTQIFNTTGGGRLTPYGPRDIIKAPGLNKVSVIPDVTVKIEKVEPPEEETDKSSGSPESLSCLQSFSESHHHEFDIRVVKEEADLDGFSSELCSISCRGDSENLKLVFADADFPRPPINLSCELESPVSKFDSIHPNTPIPPVIVPDSTHIVSLSLSGPSPTSTSMVTLSNPVLLTQTVDNSTHPCCLLFAAVWKILGLIYDPVPYNSGIKTTPRIVLNLRLVCQHWRLGVDKYYENLSVDMHDHIFKLKVHCLHQRNLKMCKNRNGMKKLVPSTWRVFDFDSSSKINRFLKHFKETHSLLGPLCVQRKKSKNPVLGRFVTFTGGICSGTPESNSCVTKLLEIYGRHVWYCAINIQEDISSISRHIESVIKWLQLMPKLKHFTWKSKLSSKETDFKAKQHIFPHMKHLKRVHFGALTTDITHQFIMSNYHIDALTMQILAPKSVELFSLKELNLELHSDNMFRNFELVNQHWPLLERIRLFLLMKDTSISWRRAMKVLESWKNTLTHVSIVLPTPPNPHEHSDLKRLPYRLDLPRVKYLKLNLRDGFASLNRDASLDFLSPLRESLQYLHLEYCSAFDYNFRHDSSCLWVLPSNRQAPFIFDYDSNVWNVFLKLEKVYVARFRGCITHPCYVARTYSREGWYYHRSSNGKSIHPFIKFEMGDCNLGFHTEYACIFGPTSLKTECNLAAKDLYCAWRSLNNTEVDEDRQIKLENYFSNCISQYVKERIFASFEFYKYSNYLSNGNSKKCGICPSKYCFDNEKGFEEHWRRNHFLYGGVYKCDLIGCQEIFSSKYDVVQHRKTHGKKHIQLYYELEAIPLQNLSLPEMKQIFNWIHVDPPFRFRERRHWPGFAKRLQSEFW